MTHVFEEFSPPVGGTSVEGEPSEAFDVGELLGRCMGEIAVAQLVLSRFAARLSSKVDEIGQALASDDASRAASLTHALKGEAASVSASPLSSAAARLEQAIRSASESEARLGFAELQAQATLCLQLAPAALEAVSH